MESLTRFLDLACIKYIWMIQQDNLTLFVCDDYVMLFIVIVIVDACCFCFRIRRTSAVINYFGHR